MFCTEERASVKALKHGAAWPVRAAHRSLGWVWAIGGDLGTLSGQARQVGARAEWALGTELMDISSSLDRELVGDRPAHYPLSVSPTSCTWLAHLLCSLQMHHILVLHPLQTNWVPPTRLDFLKVDTLPSCNPGELCFCGPILLGHLGTARDQGGRYRAGGKKN